MAASKDTAISCLNLRKTFLQGNVEIKVLDGVNLVVKNGERVAIVGTSGSGKSTLLHLLGGLDRANEGEIQIYGQNIFALDEIQKCRLRNEKLGFIYQFHHLLPEFTAQENVVMPLLIRGTEKTVAYEQAQKMLAKVGLAERIHHRPNELSGGERSRTALARALVTRPACVLADEPTGNLDQQTAQQVFELMLGLNREFGISFVIATHDHLIANKTDRVLRLLNGVLLEEIRH